MEKAVVLSLAVLDLKKMIGRMLNNVKISPATKNMFLEPDPMAPEYVAA